MTSAVHYVIQVRRWKITEHLCRITGSAKPLAIKWEIDEYLCPKMDHNPWSPTTPGKHGFMQVGLGQDKVRFNKPDIRHIFVGAGGRFKYSGKYEVSRVDALSVAEWKTLPDKVPFLCDPDVLYHYISLNLCRSFIGQTRILQDDVDQREESKPRHRPRNL